MRSAGLVVVVMIALAGSQVQPAFADGLSLVRQQIISASIDAYPGACPCPESRDHANRTCGKRSAWYRRGGYQPLCYVSDVTPDIVAAWRSGDRNVLLHH